MKVCASCGAAEGEGRHLLSCGGCKQVFYCSEDCQRADWRAGHKALCKAILGPQQIKITPETGLDYNKALTSASSSLPNLQHVAMDLPQDNLLNLDLGYEGQPPEDKIKLKPDSLSTFFENCDNELLLSFEMTVGDCCERQIRRMTDGGRALHGLIRHTNLHTVRFRRIVFASPQDLTSLVESLEHSLRVLVLGDVTIGPQDARIGWLPSQISAIVPALNKLKHLVQLSITYCSLVDSDLQPLLVDMADLRILQLPGNFSPQHSDEAGFLTDAGFRVIARSCPHLQELDVDYHRGATIEGVQAILSGCPDLRELGVSGVKIPATEVKDLLLMAPKLLIFRWASGGGPHPQRSSREDAALRDAIVANGGRTVLVDPFSGIISIPGVPANCRQETERTKQLVEDHQQRLEDPNVLNMWEGL